MLKGLTVKNVPEATIRYVLCKHMNWDYWTYQEQPESFIKEILLHMQVEADVSKDSDSSKPVPSREEFLAKLS